ncbi:MAG: beta-ketoacyl synthase N-terminal-like domain-containing protein [Acidimicrobiales bacterium]
MAEATARSLSPDLAPAAIVGMACVLPGAPDLETFWANVVGGVDSITEVPADRWDPVFYDPSADSPDRFYCRRGGFVDSVADFDPTAFGMMPLAVDGAEPDQLLALAVAARALADAGDPHRVGDPQRVGVIVGRGGYTGSGLRRLEQRVHTAEQLVLSLRALLPGLGTDQLASIKAEFVERLGPARPESAIDLVPNLTASRISNRLDLRGPSHTVDAACASALVALDQALDQLRSGRCDVVVAGGVHHCHDITLWSVFTQLGAISRRQELRVFDRRADGLLIGEGTVMFVLKRLSDAEEAGDRVYAVVRGTGISSDGRATSLMSPSVEGQVLALHRAWEAAERNPDAAGLVEAHGTGTPTGDEVELRTLRTVFGPPSSRLPRPGLGSVKSMIGHAMPAAGAAGLAKAALAVFHGKLPPTLHAEEPHPLVEATRFRLVQSTEPWDGDGPRLAGVNSFGFGGINAHVVIEEHLPSTGRSPHPRRVRPHGHLSANALHPAGGPRGEVVALPAPTPTNLISALGEGGQEAVLLLAGDTPSEVGSRLADLAAHWPGPGGGRPRAGAPSGEGGCRLAVVDPTPKRLELAAAVVTQGRPFTGRNDVWFQPTSLIGSGDGMLAFVFPGLEPEFTPRLEDVASAIGFDARRIVGGATSLEVLGPAVIDAGRLLYRAFEQVGLRPDLCAGHSVGEWTAQVVTGMTPPTALEPLLDELSEGRLPHPDVAYLALGCGAQTAEEMVADLGDVVLSHDNCLHQSVVCGTDASLEVARQRAVERKLFAQELPFRSGFHTPMFEPYVESIRQLFGSLPVGRPSVPVWSATSCAPYPDDPVLVRELTVDHLTHPVNFRGLVTRLHEHGVRVFLEVGVGSLVGFVDDILGDLPHLAVPATNPKRTGLQQLRRACAALWCAGARLDPEALGSETPGQQARLTPPRREGGGTPHSQGRRALRMGSQMVRDLRPLAAEDRPRAALAVLPEAFSGDLGASAPPLVAAYQAAIHEAAAASTLVLERWSRAERSANGNAPLGGEPPGGEHRPPRPAGHPAGRLPEEPSRELAREETFSLATYPAFADHAVFSQPEGWPDQSDRFPIVPLTAMISRFCELAGECCPSLVAVAVTDVRATRWLVVEPPTTATLRATLAPSRPDGLVAVRVAIEGHARATVLMGHGYPEPSPTGVTRGPGATGWARGLPYPPADIYAERWLFHGPAYRAIDEITGWDDSGIEGRVTALEAPGVLLDSAGQVLGLWVALALDDRRTVLPTSVERISFYGPPPRPGASVRCRAAVAGVDHEGVVASLELTGPDGVWARVEGWTERRFDVTNQQFELSRSPGDHVMSEITDHGWAWTQETWLDPASREMTMRLYLNAAERQAYATRNPRAQRNLLLGRVALKDLLRLQRWRRGAGPIFPAEITVANDPHGRPYVSGAVDPGVEVSVAHSQGIGVAISSRNGPVGIDVEAVGPRGPGFADLVLTDGERELVESMTGSPDECITTIWTLKEAAAKAAGTGLMGAPKAFEITERDGGRYRIGDRWLACDRLVADLYPSSSPSEKGVPTAHVVSWTLP